MIANERMNHLAHSGAQTLLPAFTLGKLISINRLLGRITRTRFKARTFLPACLPFRKAYFHSPIPWTKYSISLSFAPSLVRLLSEINSPPQANNIRDPPIGSPLHIESVNSSHQIPIVPYLPGTPCTPIKSIRILTYLLTYTTHLLRKGGQLINHLVHSGESQLTLLR